MVDVDRNNFKSGLSKLKACLNEANLVYIALDLEFTGLHTNESMKDRVHFRQNSPIDEMIRALKSAHKFSVCQFGVSCFFYNPSNNSLSSYPFNFTIFPSNHNSHPPATSFVNEDMCLQTSSIEYLMKHRFDIHKWMSRGISWISLERFNNLKAASKIEKYIESMTAKLRMDLNRSYSFTHNPYHPSNSSSSSSSSQTTTTTTMTQTHHHHPSSSSASSSSPILPSSGLPSKPVIRTTDLFYEPISQFEKYLKLPFKKKPKYLILKCMELHSSRESNSFKKYLSEFWRYYRYNNDNDKCVVTRHYKNNGWTKAPRPVGNYHHSHHGNLRGYLHQYVICRDSQTHESLMRKWLKMDYLQRLDESLGATKVFIAICEANVPIIVHNGLLDVCHLLYSFMLDRSIPENRVVSSEKECVPKNPDWGPFNGSGSSGSGVNTDSAEMSGSSANDEDENDDDDDDDDDRTDSTDLDREETTSSEADEKGGTHYSYRKSKKRPKIKPIPIGQTPFELMATVKKYLPCIIDTKVLALSLPVISDYFNDRSGLNWIYSVLNKPFYRPFIDWHPDLKKHDSKNRYGHSLQSSSSSSSSSSSNPSSSSSSKKSGHSSNGYHHAMKKHDHEAGWDSFCTGLIFARLIGMAIKLYEFNHIGIPIPKNLFDFSKIRSNETVQFRGFIDKEMWCVLRNTLVLRKMPQNDFKSKKMVQKRKSRSSHHSVSSFSPFKIPYDPTKSQEWNVLCNVYRLLGCVHLFATKSHRNIKLY